MLRRFGQHLRIGVSSEGVAIARTSIWRAGRARLLAERRIAPTGQVADIVAALGELLAAAPPGGTAVSIVLADELVRMWQVTPPPACSRLSDLHAAAALRFHALFGTAPAGWRIAAAWDAARPFLAVAVPEELLAQIEKTVRDQRGHVVEVVPQFVAAYSRWSAHRPPGAWFGLMQSHVLSLALFDGPKLAAVRSAAVPQGAGREWLDALVAREALRLGLKRPQQLQLLGPAPTSWASHSGRASFGCSLIDLDEAVPLSDLARLVCAGNTIRNKNMNLALPSLRRTFHCTPRPAQALAVAALALVPVVATGLSQYSDALRRHEATLAAQLVRHQAPAAHAVPSTLVLPEQAAAVNAAIMQLNLPWRQLHDAVQSATPSTVALLALEPDAKKHVLRITAEAKTSADMIDYLEQIKGQHWFSTVNLTRHEVNDQDQNHPIRFQLDAQWRQP